MSTPSDPSDDTTPRTQPNSDQPTTTQSNPTRTEPGRPSRFGRPPLLRRAEPRERPEAAFDPGLQQERTHLAWERTAVSTMVSGVLLARFAAYTGHVLIGLFSLTIVVFGASVLLWAGSHYDDLHSQLRKGQNPAHVAMTRFVGLGAVAATGAALVIVAIVLTER